MFICMLVCLGMRSLYYIYTYYKDYVYFFNISSTQTHTHTHTNLTTFAIFTHSLRFDIFRKQSPFQLLFPVFKVWLDFNNRPRQSKKKREEAEKRTWIRWRLRLGKDEIIGSWWWFQVFYVFALDYLGKWSRWSNFKGIFFKRFETLRVCCN